ncbi:MAG: AEC family transporter [Bacillota bacterium]|jgi:predicted permease
MDKRIIITQVTTLFLIMVVGFGARKTKIINTEVNKGLTGLLINITAPFMALSSFQFAFSRQMLAEVGTVLLFAVGAHLLAIFLGELLYGRMPGATGKVLRFITIFSNCGFMGYPVAGAFFGERGIFLASIYNAVFNLLVWTYGVYIFTGKTSRDAFRRALVNPGVIAVLLGMVLFLFSLKLPEPVGQTLQMVGAMTTPLSMLIVGAMLTEVRPAALFSGAAVYWGSMVRLVGMPLLALLGLKLLGVKGVALGVCMLMVAMPAAALAAPLADQYDGDVVFASRVVFISTILSMVTIPLLTFLL